jgi:hypothetical protein
MHLQNLQRYFAIRTWAIRSLLDRFWPIRLRRDLAPDYLNRCSGPIFERDGFCFTVSLAREDGVATFTIMYQNRYAAECLATVALRPAGSSLAVHSPGIQCGPGGFGVATFPAAFAARHQGKMVTLQIGADVVYPCGRGAELRFRTGRAVPWNAQFVARPPIARLALANRLTKRILFGAARIRVRLPRNVAEELPNEAIGHVEEIWRQTHLSGPAQH